MTANTITAEQLAKQFGLKSEHGTYASRVILSSPLDGQRCRTLIAEITHPNAHIHQRKPEDISVPFNPADPDSLIVREAPLPVIDELFREYGTALTLACTSQLSELYFLAWGMQARPLLFLLKECSYLPAFSEFVRTDATGKKLYNTYIRSILRLIRDGGWVDRLGVTEELGDMKYTHFGEHSELDVLGGLLVALPTLLNIVSSLASVPFSPGNVKATQHTKVQLHASIDKLAQLSLNEARSAILWDDAGEATEMGNHVAYVYDALIKVAETLRL